MGGKTSKRKFMLWAVLTAAAVAGLGVFLAVWGLKGGSQVEASNSGRDVRLVNMKFPAFVYNSAGSLKGYRIALTMPDVLSRIPCYCGCVDVGHKSLKECFISPQGEFDPHASGCSICYNEAADVYNLYRKGLSTLDIRKFIENKYKAYGKPTDTPPIM
jgi:hypothetical protein